MDWKFIDNLPNLYDKINPRKKDKNFDLEGFETLIPSKSPQLLDSVETHFNGNYILIKYEKEDSILALMLTAIRVCDPYFGCKNIIVGEKEFAFDDYNDESVIMSKLFKNVLISNTIKIIPQHSDDYFYSETLLVYKITSDHDTHFYFEKELKRW